MYPLSRRAREIEPFRVMAILSQARALEAQGRDVIHLEIGEPDFPTPAPIIEAGRAALARGATHYTPALGLPELRQAIAEHYSRQHGVALEAERVCVTPGASGALLLAMAALFDPGDEVLMADPGYPCNRHFARLVEARAVGIPVGPESRFQLTAEQVAQAWGPRTKGVLLANPGNPTGTLTAPRELAAIHALVREKGGVLLVDEIYHALVYEAVPSTAAALGEDVVVINSFSKYFLMTGWRLGWMLAPREMIPALDRLAQNLFLAPSTVAQHAALTALSDDIRPLLEEARLALKSRRDWLAPRLRGLGLDIPVTPDGAFYLYADIHRLGQGAEALAADWLNEIGVAVTPGTDFGAHGADRHVRFAYTTSLERIQEAVRRIEARLG
ncbi:MAG: pyridoxal phosphate-dependent aminotransferase [Pseudomonadota bacterium]